MIIILKSSIKFLNVLFMIVLVTLIAFINVNTYMRAHNQFKYKELSNSTNKQTADLILLTVTGDERYKNYQLTNIYKNLQIIHVLVISGSNISILLSLIHLFIYRKNMNSYLFSLFIIYIYGKLIYFPETIIRALQSLIICSFNTYLGLRICPYKIFLTTLLFAILTIFTSNTGFSYQLSFIYFSVIYINSHYLIPYFKSKILSFLVTNFILTITSAILFKHSYFSVSCVSYIANTFITYLYEFAIKLAYIAYLMPNVQFLNFFYTLTGTLFELLFSFLNLMQFFTYNICNEKIFKF